MFPARLLAFLRLAAATLLLAPFGLAGCGAAKPGDVEVTDERKGELAKEWQLYLRNDPKWPETRERWLSGPDGERELLLDNLMIELMRDDAAARGNATGSRSARARRELTWFGAEAVAPLVEGMKGLATREGVDVVAIDRIALALVELHAVDAVIELLDATPKDEANVRVRRAALLALSQFDDPKATAAIVGLVRTDPAWQVRGAAAEALCKRTGNGAARAALLEALADSDGYVRSRALPVLVIGLDPEVDPAALDQLLNFLLADPAPEMRSMAAESLALFTFDPRVKAALVRALRDRDLGVVGKAAHALLNVSDREVQLAVVDALERAVKQRNEGLVSELLRILAANVGARPDDINPAGWRALIEQRAGKR